jgi:hypothetical protein
VLMPHGLLPLLHADAGPLSAEPGLWLRASR